MRVLGAAGDSGVAAVATDAQRQYLPDAVVRRLSREVINNNSYHYGYWHE